MECLIVWGSWGWIDRRQRGRDDPDSSSAYVSRFLASSHAKAPQRHLQLDTSQRFAYFYCLLYSVLKQWTPERLYSTRRQKVVLFNTWRPQTPEDRKVYGRASILTSLTDACLASDAMLSAVFSSWPNLPRDPVMCRCHPRSQGRLRMLHATSAMLSKITSIYRIRREERVLTNP
jgi:hypothetical protein